MCTLYIMKISGEGEGSYPDFPYYFPGYSGSVIHEMPECTYARKAKSLASRVIYDDAAGPVRIIVCSKMRFASVSTINVI